MILLRYGTKIADSVTSVGSSTAGTSQLTSHSDQRLYASTLEDVYLTCSLGYYVKPI